MSDSSASSGEMPGFPFPSRPGREPDEPLLDMILNGQPLPADAPHHMLALADKLGSLAGPAGPGAVPGEVGAMAAFSSSVPPTSISPAGTEPARPKPARPKLARRRRTRLRTLRPARLACGILAVMVGLSSAAAYADVLPGPVQDFAHHVIDAPPAHASDSRSGEHQKAADRSGSTHAPASGRHAPNPAKPGKAKGNAEHASRPSHGKRGKAGHPAHPAHPAPSHPAPSHPAHSAAPKD